MRPAMLKPVQSTLDISIDKILAVSCVRDEILRLPWFLEYHRNLGVDHFLIIDNDSSDGTSEYLRRQGDVSLFPTRESYSASKCGVTWTNEVLENFGRDHWVLILDADELFVYPRCETVNLRALVTYLNELGAQAMMAPLLDMYSDRAISETSYRSGMPFYEACSYFDGDNYEQAELGPNSSLVRSRGGARHRLFWKSRNREYSSPFLPKIPLVKWRNGISLDASTHIMSGARLAEATGVLLHFKLFQDFAARAKHEAARGEHFANARQYAAYSEVLSSDTKLSAYHEGSIRYENSIQLVRLGLMGMPKGFPRASG